MIMLKKYTKDSSGFSFMELMVVIAMIGILSAVALPGILRALPEQRVKNAARNLYADMQRARLLAVKENRNVAVKFDSDAAGGFYYFVDDVNKGAADAGFRRNLSEDGDVSFGKGKATTDWEDPPNSLPTLPTDNTIFSSTGEATFDSGLNPSIILLQNQNQDVCYAVVTTNFGAVQIRRFNGSGWDEQ
jgi:prepilin-type N-terminal cleavage/methylation domain-containing protein